MAVLPLHTKTQHGLEWDPPPCPPHHPATPPRVPTGPRGPPPRGPGGSLARGWRHLALGGAVQALDPPDVVLVQLQVRPGGRVAAGWKQDLALVLFSPKIDVLMQEVRFHKT